MSPPQSAHSALSAHRGGPGSGVRVGRRNKGCRRGLVEGTRGAGEGQEKQQGVQERVSRRSKGAENEAKQKQHVETCSPFQRLPW